MKNFILFLCFAIDVFSSDYDYFKPLIDIAITSSCPVSNEGFFATLKSKNDNFWINFMIEKGLVYQDHYSSNGQYVGKPGYELWDYLYGEFNYVINIGQEKNRRKYQEEQERKNKEEALRLKKLNEESKSSWECSKSIYDLLYQRDLAAYEQELASCNENYRIQKQRYDKEYTAQVSCWENNYKEKFAQKDLALKQLKEFSKENYRYFEYLKYLIKLYDKLISYESDRYFRLSFLRKIPFDFYIDDISVTYQKINIASALRHKLLIKSKLASVSYSFIIGIFPGLLKNMLDSSLASDNTLAKPGELTEILTWALDNLNKYSDLFDKYTADPMNSVSVIPKQPIYKEPEYIGPTISRPEYDPPIFDTSGSSINHKIPQIKSKRKNYADEWRTKSYLSEKESEKEILKAGEIWISLNDLKKMGLHQEKWD